MEDDGWVMDSAVVGPAQAKRGFRGKEVKNFHLSENRMKRALNVRTSNQNCEVGVVDGGIRMDESAT